MTIDMKKTYRTRDGREVRIYAVDGLAGKCIHGAIFSPDGWEHRAWFPDGRTHFCSEMPADLVEVRPRIKREVWVNVYPRSISPWGSKKDADYSASEDRLACVKLVIDCEEGEGLSNGYCEYGKGLSNG